MNIAIINEFFPPFITGGTEIFLNELARYLKSRGHKIIVITSDQGQKENKEFKIYKIKSSPFHLAHRYQFSGITTPWMFFNFRLRKKLNKIYKEEKIDLLYVNNLFHLSFSPIQASNLPVILDVHDYWPVCFSKDLYYSNKEFCENNNVFKCSYCLGKKSNLFLSPFLPPTLKIEKYLSKRWLKRSSKTICHSEFVSKILEKHGYVNRVIPYPYLGKLEKKEKRKNGIFRLLFVGRVEKRKGADIMLKVAEELKGKMDFRIDVIGEGPLINKLNREDLNIFTHGFLGEERFEYFKKADCLLVPSRWPEPFGMIVLEAMAYKIPIIALDNGGLAELIRENKAGFLVNEADFVKKVLSLYNNQKLLNKIRRQEKGVKKYKNEKIFQEYEMMFRKV